MCVETFTSNMLLVFENINTWLTSQASGLTCSFPILFGTMLGYYLKAE